MCEYGRGLDGRTVASGRHGQSGELRRGRGLRGAWVQARLGRRKDWEASKPKSSNGSYLLNASSFSLAISEPTTTVKPVQITENTACHNAIQPGLRSQ